MHHQFKDEMHNSKIDLNFLEAFAEYFQKANQFNTVKKIIIEPKELFSCAYYCKEQTIVMKNIETQNYFKYASLYEANILYKALFMN